MEIRNLFSRNIRILLSGLERDLQLGSSLDRRILYAEKVSEIENMAMSVVENADEKFSEALFDHVDKLKSELAFFWETEGESPNSQSLRAKSYQILNSIGSSIALHLIDYKHPPASNLINREFASWEDISTQSTKYLDELLEIVKLDSFDQVFSVGTFDKKKTIETQQLRAATIALSVARRHKDRQLSVGIIGGGFAGVTACATFLRLGHNATIFEATSKILQLQWNSGRRFIHPGMYDWPHTDWHRESFDIAGLSWNAGYADDVVWQVFNDFSNVCANSVGAYNFNPWTDICRIEQTISGKGMATYKLVERRKQLGFPGFDVVLICAGFGLERQPDMGVELQSYWEGPPISAVDDVGKEDVRSILISGSGDGGLVDVIQTSLGGVQHHEILDLVPEINEPEMREAILETENDIQTDARAPVPILNILELYRERLAGINVEQLKAAKHPFRRVFFNASITGVFSPNTAPINRVLASLLEQAGIITLRIERITPEMVSRDYLTRNWRVSWSHFGSEEFDTIIARHGVDSNFFKRAFPTHVEDASEIASSLRRFDVIRIVPEDVVKTLRELKTFRISGMI